MPAVTQEQDIDSMTERITDNIIRAADLAIPATSGGPYRSSVSCWNEDCKNTRIEKKRATRRYQRSHSIADGIALRRARAIARRAQRQARKQCWLDFVSSINEKTLYK